MQLQFKINKKEYGYIFFIGMVFFFVYDVNFSFLPFTTNVILAICGVCLFIPYILKTKHRIMRASIGTIIVLILFIIWSLWVVMINQTYETGFIEKEIIRNMLIPFFASFCVAYSGRKYLSNVQDVLKSILYATIIQSVITIVAFFSPFGQFIRSFQTINERLTTILDDEIRAYGLGSGFDTGSFIISYSLLISCYFFLVCEKKQKKYFSFVFLLQAFAGALMARSIIVGIVCSFVFILFFSRDTLKKIQFIVKLVVITLCLVFVVSYLFPELITRYSKTIAWLFEFITADGHSIDIFEIKSVNKLFGEMYFLPEKAMTWLVGEGKFLTLYGTPYRNTDPLYMRYILYFGLPGLIIFICFMVKILKGITAKDSQIFGIQDKERKLYDAFLVMVFIQSLCVYVKINFHCFYLLFYIGWFIHFAYSEFRDAPSRYAMKLQQVIE